MGRPKLLLPLRGRPLVRHTIDAWRQGGIESIIAVARGDDQPLAAVLREAGCDVVTPAEPPPDMKVSIQHALRHIQERHTPSASDAFLVAPADMPRLSPEIIRALTARHEADPGAILVPTLGGRRGHPVLFPWPLAAEVFQLAEDEGLNVLTIRHSVAEIACDRVVPAGSDAFADVNTLDQYQALNGE
jgi:molybdenum cofactor cytidylyltransferase